MSTKAEIQPCEHETRDRIITALVVGLPFVAVIVLGITAWGKSLNFLNLGVFVVGYFLTGLGITMGFHRLFTHRSFKCGRTLKITLAILGSMAIEGPLISWVSDHRRHHAHSDQPGDPHSPHVDHGEGFVASIKGLWHAHMGWLFMHDQR
ncbi:MAG: fatty acid desaturase, partial [Solirubrobacterales bacterium]